MRSSDGSIKYTREARVSVTPTAQMSYVAMKTAPPDAFLRPHPSSWKFRMCLCRVATSVSAETWNTSYGGDARLRMVPRWLTTDL